MISFSGDIKMTDSRLVRSAFEEWLDTNRISVKERMSGFELTYEDEDTYVFCYEATVPAGVNPFFLFEGSIKGKESDSINKLKELIRVCAGKGLECIIDYTPVDDEGDPIGEEVTITIMDASA
ncbi:hypothetical protein [Nocardia seriolae]|uniref:Uncharacterized protein n=1 Tax=Nocardia seriolae TaxID=37332 RepID=A0ABC9Z245_9NOCA|nr:hypothetical protein [Nocardia seriolae]APA97338.1 hypothetical protein NS506_03285 [Nocardia seriolae]OJF81660.1 hypothetical protein NS14008_23910 [Nocardia seriolae]PSK32783.1 hypothetical protein C6575_02835 [Nocardia seriolae]QOW34321.1 hypothetical protein IMZ23_04255 [Nocardia seriolae]QUN18222.1 hypothetical protein KEC46_01775 [Nocardia seriolae]